MKHPLVSIIIPTFNRAHLVGETLESIQKQTYSHWECIVVDDGSTDATAAVVNAYVQTDARFCYVARPRNVFKGANACRNYGFELSKGEYVNWFDDDDVMLPEFLASKVALFSEELQIVICNGFTVDEKLNNPIALPFYETATLFREYVLWRLKILTPGILFRKSFLTKKTLFSTTIKRGQETELFSRLFYEIKSNQYVITVKPLFLYRQHPESKTGRNTNYNKEYEECKYTIHEQNFFRGDTIKDVEVMNYCFKENTKLFFKALQNKHWKLATTIQMYFFSQLQQLGKRRYFEIYSLSAILVVIKFPSYRLRKRWLSFTFNHS